MAYPTKDQIREREALAKFGLKRCGSCRGIKPRVNFGKCRSRKDGLQHKCKECDRRYREDRPDYWRQWREKNPDYGREYYQKNSEVIRARGRQYYRANKEACAARKRAWLQTPAGREASRAQVRRYEQTSAGKARIRRRDRKRRALKAAVNESFTAADEAFVFERDGYRCVDCGITNQEHLAQFGQRLHIDHVLPLSKGHALTRENAALRCRSCNSTKGNRS